MEQDDDVFIVRASGELDIASTKMFEVELRRAIRSSVSGVILDLRGLIFMDSTGLRALLLAGQLSNATGRQLRILPGCPSLQRALEVSGLKCALPFVD